MTSFDYEAVKKYWAAGARVWSEQITKNDHVARPITINVGDVVVEEDLSGFDFSGCVLTFEGTSFSESAKLRQLNGVGNLVARDIDSFPEVSFAENAEIGQIFLSNIKKMPSLTIQKAKVLNSVMLTDVVITGDLNVQEEDFCSRQGSTATFQFVNVRVEQDVYIGEVKVPGNFGFYGCEFLDQFTCEKSTFRLPLVLERCKFASLVDFTGSEFKYPPNVRGSVFHGSPLWPDESAFEVTSRSPPKRANQNIDACVSLRMEATSKGDMRNKKMFSILEQRYRILAKQIPFFDKVIFHSYGLMSDFGRSIVRTVFTMLLAAVVFGIVYFLIRCPNVLHGQPVNWAVFWESFHESVKNTFLPASALLSQTSTMPETLAKIGHAILSGILFAQLFMSTRWALNAN